MQNTKEIDVQLVYRNLLNICIDSTRKIIGGNFRYADQITSLGTKVRIFTYDIAGYSDWMLPDALMCRGIMFEMDNEKPVRIMSLPMDKFFNYSELIGWSNASQPTSHSNMELPKLEDILYLMDKRDGSLISTFYDTNGGISNLLLKSKGSINSEQSNDSSLFLYQENQNDLLEFCTRYAKENFTVNMEWTAPNNQIVLRYSEPELRILNIRCNKTGDYVDGIELLKDPVFAKYAADIYAMPDNYKNLADWIEDVYKLKGIEGYIAVTTKGMFKCKTDQYVALHHTKDSINNNNRLMLVCADNGIDDIKQMFRDDPTALYKIDVFDNHFTSLVSGMMQKLIAANQSYKGLERRDYAKSMSKEFGKSDLFHIAMQMYIGGTEGLVDKILGFIKSNPERYLPVGYSNAKN